MRYELVIEKEDVVIRIVVLGFTHWAHNRIDTNTFLLVKHNNETQWTGLHFQPVTPASKKSKNRDPIFNLVTVSDIIKAGFEARKNFLKKEGECYVV